MDYRAEERDGVRQAAASRKLRQWTSRHGQLAEEEERGYILFTRMIDPDDERMHAPLQQAATFPIRRRTLYFLVACAALLLSGPSVLLAQAPPVTSQCDTQGKGSINVACDYVEAPAPVESSSEFRIVLNHAVISFTTKDENFMSVELTFTNRGKSPVQDARTVYLAVDDDAGHNQLRRPLTKVDFRSLVPGKRVTFSDRLLIGVLRPGHYVIELWIPSADPSAAFDKAHNVLLSNVDVPDQRSGLNKIATITILH